jgi:hypothetical protein
MVAKPNTRRCTLFAMSISVALLLNVSFLPQAESKPTACKVPNQIIKRGAGWTTIKLPEFPTPASVGIPGAGGSIGYHLNPSVFSVDPFDSRRIVVTNGEMLMGSLDGGCTWREEFRMPATIPNDSVPMGRPPEIRSVRILSGFESAPRRTLVLTGSQRAVELLISSDDGKSFAPPTSIEGGQFIGSQPALASAPSDPSVVYLLTAGVQTVRLLNVSHDAGDTWKLMPPLDVAHHVDFAVNEPSPIARTTEVFGLDVSPKDPKELIAYSQASVIHTADSGATWSGEPQFAKNGSKAMAWGGASDGTDTLVGIPYADSCAGAMSQATDCSYRSFDRGTSWDRLVLPGRLTLGGGTSMVAGGSPGTIVASVLAEEGGAGTGGLQNVAGTCQTKQFRFDSRVSKWIEITPRYGVELDCMPMDLQMDRMARPSLYFVGLHTIERYSGHL